MAVDAFLKIDDIKGESSDAKHKDQIDVLSWSWGATQTATTHSGTGGGAGKVNVQDLAITKYVDSSTPVLLSYCLTGKHAKTADLIVRKAGGEALEYLKIHLEDIIVSSVSQNGSPGQERLTESLTLNFARVKLEYTPQNAKGAGAGAVTVGYDIAQNVKMG